MVANKPATMLLSPGEEQEPGSRGDAEVGCFLRDSASPRENLLAPHATGRPVRGLRAQRRRTRHIARRLR